MMDFTFADMKFRSHFNDDEEEEYDKSRLSMSVSHSLGFVSKVHVTNIFWQSINSNISKIN